MLYNILDLSVPKFHTLTTRNYPPWFSKEIKQNLKCKERCRKKWLKNRTESNFNEFKKIRTLVKIQIKESYQTYINDVQSKIKSQPSDLWKFANSKRGISRIPYKLRDNSNEYSDPKDIVNAFASTFSSFFTQNPQLHPEDVLSNCNNFTIPNVSEEDLLKIMSKLSNKTTSGDDQLPSFLIKDCKYVFVDPLQTIINLAITTKTFPVRWKIARITPVFKKGDKSLLENYRPIALLNNFAKLFEQIIYQCILHNVRPYFSEFQHGFLPGRSTITNLAVLSQFVAETLDEQGQVDVVYTDFTKAFDTLNHDLILSKLSSLGAAPSVVQLILSYLSQRACYVTYNGFKSYEFTATSGVPQGSNLGPLLFNIFINDLLSSLNTHVLAYADDVKIFSKITSPNDATELQKNIDNIVDWCSDNKLILNIKKCSIVSYVKKKSPYMFEYQIAGSPLTRMFEVTDLGVTFTTTLNFDKHINNMCISASKMLGFILRITYEFHDLEAIKTLFYAFVLSKLEYANLIWYPYYISHHMLPDKIFRKFLKFLSFKMDQTYPERGISQEELLSRHQMTSLTARRDMQSAKFLLKIVKNEVDAPSLLSKLNFLVPRAAARQRDTFYQDMSRTNTLKRAPVQVMVKNAEHLFEDIFHVMTLSVHL